MNIEETAEYYYETLTRPLADEKGLVETAFVIGATSQAAKEQIMESLIDDIEMNLDDWCRTPLVMATKFRDKQFKQEKL